MIRLAKLATMVSVVLLGLLLLASDSQGSGFYMNDEVTILTYEGDLVISGAIEIRDEDGDVVDVQSKNISVGVRVYDENGEIFTQNDHPFIYKSNILEIRLRNEDIKILENKIPMNYNIELELNYEDGDSNYGYGMKSIIFEYRPKEEI